MAFCPTLPTQFTYFAPLDTCAKFICDKRRVMRIVISTSGDHGNQTKNCNRYKGNTYIFFEPLAMTNNDRLFVHKNLMNNSPTVTMRKLLTDIYRK